MKKLSILTVFIVVLCMMLSMTASANGEISVLIDGTAVNFDVPPQIINGRTMVPMRAIFEQLGATVTWDDATKTATGTTADTTVSVTINSTAITVNGEIKTMDVAPQIVGGRTLVPARFISEAFGCSIEWDGDSRTVFITTASAEDVKTTFEYYTDSTIPFPKYDSVTGRALIDIYSDGTANVMMYEYSADSDMLLYFEALTAEGWQFDGTDYDEEFSSLSYYYTKDFHSITVSREYDFNEVWVTYILAE